ncbi:hypothetical protein PtB15_18B343 [Puccinia triticina]|nr:hypothetical protein PtB15_18B343 [Puccinia triticina]
MPPRKPQKNKLVCTCFGHKCREKTHWVSHENVWKPGCLLVSQTVFRHQLSDQAASTVLPPDDNTLDLESPAELQTHLGSTENPAPNLAARDNTALATITDSLALTRISAGPGFFRLVYDTSRWMTSPFLNTRPVFTYAILAASMFTILLSASNLSSSWLLRKQRQLIELTLRLGLNSSSAPRPLTATENAALNKLPVDIHTVIKWLKLDPIIVCLNCCSRCFATYPPDRTPRNCFHQEDIIDKEVDGDPLSIPDIPEIPEERETAKRIPQQSQAPKETPISSKFGGEPLLQPGTNVPIETPISSKFCGEPLLQPGTNVLIRKFAFQRLNDWLGRLFSRPGIENALDQSLSTSPADPSHEMITDIHDSAIWHEFKGPDGSPFTATSGNLVFGLFIDGINPYGSKQGGKHVSITFVVLVCLTLPYSLRFLPENVFLVGIAPGPKEPSLTQTNWILNPLVQQLKSLWTNGLFLSSTPLHPKGRQIFAALLPVFADLPALRRAIGFAGHASAEFMCSFCNILKENIRNLAEWSPRTSKNHIKWAHASRDAHTAKDRAAIFAEHGVQYSVLTELSYWRPIEYQALDSMHNLLLGLLKWHCIRFWAISNKLDNEEDHPLAIIPVAEMLQVSAAAVSDTPIEHADASLKLPEEELTAEEAPFELRSEQGLKVDLRLPANEDEYFINIKDVVSHCAWLEYKSGELNSKLQYSTLALISMDRE